MPNTVHIRIKQIKLIFIKQESLSFEMYQQPFFFETSIEIQIKSEC